MTQNVDLSKLQIRRDDPPVRDNLPRPRFWYLIYIGSALFLLLAGFFFYRTVASEEVVELTTVTFISPAQASSLLTASGYIVAQRKAAIASKATGRLVQLNYREGDHVKKGEIIGRIESADVEASLTQALADLEVARADKNDAEQTLKRSKQLLDRQLISQADYDAAKSRFDRVVATITSREAAVQGAKVQLENTLIRAPFDGTILTKNADVGEVVTPFAAGASSRVAVVTIADMSSLEVEADVSESNIERIKLEQPCEIVLDAYPDKRYSGNVDKIVPTADRSKATVLTKVRFAERDNRVLPEMSAKVHFLSNEMTQGKSFTPKLAVNPSALITIDNKNMAFVFKNNIVNSVPVTTGETMGNLIEVTSGLASGDQVVLKPSESLQTGMKVKIKQ